jgi:hypothetical protein
VANGIVPDALPDHLPRPRHRSPWLGLTVVTAGIAIAAVVVPPLIAPRHRAAPAPASSPSVVPSSAPASTSPPPARFVPITAEAEDPHTVLTGGAAPTDCDTCHGGGRVRYVCATCRVTVRTTLPVSGRRTVTVVYEVDGPRLLKVSVNDAPATDHRVTGPGWTTPRSFRFTADLPAGPLRIALFNDESPAPDVDAVVIS